MRDSFRGVLAMASHNRSPAYLMPGTSSLRSRSSGSSASSLSSTFSDITGSSTSSVNPEASNSKTNAFFASPFSTAPPSPAPPTPPPAPPPKPRSLTEQFFSTPARPPSPPASSTVGPTTNQNAVHPSRIFPSRYTSSLRRSPDSHFISFDDIDNTPSSHFQFSSHHGHDRDSSNYSNYSDSSSCSSSFVEPRLPTPPPSASISRRSLHRDDTIMPMDFAAPPKDNEEGYDTAEEATPRPADLEPNLLHFERSLLLSRQDPKQTPRPESIYPESGKDDEVGDEEEEPHPGSIIELPPLDYPLTLLLPLSPLSLNFTIASPESTSTIDRGTPTPTNESSTFVPSIPSTTSHTQGPPSTQSSSPESVSSPLPPTAAEPAEFTETPRLRLVKSLGHGAFSAVWLAEDLSRVPLTLVSKKSVRDLRRRASGRERTVDLEREDVRMKDKFEFRPEVPAKTEKTAGAPAARRPPSRLREGLRNMLSFSRSSTIPAMPSPISPSLSGMDVHEDGTLSRHSSIKSLPSVASEHSSLSRNSSVRSSASRGPSRNSSLRLALRRQQQAIEGDNAILEAAAASLSRDSSLKKFRERVRGTKPAPRLGRSYLDERDGEMGEPMEYPALSINSAGDGSALGGRLSRNSSLGSAPGSAGSLGGGSGWRTTGRLVAVKMTPRKPRGQHARGKEREEEERTRVGFVREVEVLRHISHPNITPLLAHLSTSTHHILVLPYLRGGDLLGLVNNDVAWGKLSESVLRRIWCELCKAVGWMHGVGLVHRDIKLENILLTTQTFTSLTPLSARPTLSSLPLPPAPLIKLTDFGLSRFVELTPTGDAELLTTRCGSEAYAAPELVTGASGGYDARRTDAWACGVVLYALVGRRLPFGEGVGTEGEGEGKKIGGERGAAEKGYSAAERRHWLMRIARGEWEWPGDSSAEPLEQTLPSHEMQTGKEGEEEELVGPRLVRSQGAKRIVSRLLVRDPRKRARIVDLWDDVWMQGGFSGEDVGGGGSQRHEGEGRVPSEGAHDVLMGAAPGLGEEAKAPERLPAARIHEEEKEERNPHMLQDIDGDDDVEDEDEFRFYDQPSAFGADYLFEDGVEGYDAERGPEGGGVGREEERGERLEFEEEDEEEGGCLFDHEEIDSITRREVV